MPRAPQTAIDPEFWDRLRNALKSHLNDSGLKQRELAPRLGIDQTTLSNFLNRQSDRLGGLAVALACTIVDLSCDGKLIGRVRPPNGARESETEPNAAQLELEFDDQFELKHDSGRTTIILRKPPSRQDRVKLSITKVG